MGLFKIPARLSYVKYEFFISRWYYILHPTKSLKPCYPKEPLLYRHPCNFMRFSDTFNSDIPKSFKYGNCDSCPFNSCTSSSKDETSKNSLGTPLNDTLSYKTSRKTQEFNPSCFADSSSFPSHTNPSNGRHPKHYQLRKQSRKVYRLFLLLSKILEQ